VIRKCFLRPVLGLSVLTNHLSDTQLQRGAGALHLVTLK